MLRDGKGNPIGFEFDADGNLLQIEQADGSEEQFVHDAQGNLIQTVNRRGRPISFTRDGRELWVALSVHTTLEATQSATCPQAWFPAAIRRRSIVSS